MAIGDKPQSTFVQVRKGKFTIWNGTENIEHGFVSGHLTKIDFHTMPQTAKQKYPNFEDIRLHMQDGEEHYIVTCAAKTSAGRSLMKQLPNVDPSLPIELTASYEEEYKSTTVFVKQGGASLKWFWKSGDMKDLPGPVKYIDPADGTEKTQFNDQVAYLKAYVLAHVAPKLTTPDPEVPDFREMEEIHEDMDQIYEDDAPF